jgi:hypothetical protein
MLGGVPYRFVTYGNFTHMSDAEALISHDHLLCMLPVITPPVSAFTVATA